MGEEVLTRIPASAKPNCLVCNAAYLASTAVTSTSIAIWGHALDCENFDAETRRVLGVAFEAVCVALRTDCDDYINEAIAKRR